jgi:hypothetical protein
MFDYIRSHVKICVKHEISNLINNLHNCSQSQDVTLLQIVLSYFSILQNELNRNRMSVNQEQYIHRIHTIHSKILYELRMFAQHLQLETKYNIQFQFLNSDSVQYKRCKKAIKDNIPVDVFNEIGIENLKVTCVVKLNHQVLSERLQV